MANIVDQTENFLVLAAVALLGYLGYVAYKNLSHGGAEKITGFLGDSTANAEQAVESSTDPVNSEFIANEIDGNQTAEGLIHFVPSQLYTDPGKFLADNGIF